MFASTKEPPTDARSVTVANIDARNVAPATITMAKIQGGRDARLALTVAGIAIRLQTLLRERIASSVTLDPNSAKISLDISALSFSEYS